MHGSDGLDEITTAGTTHVAALENGAVRHEMIGPGIKGTLSFATSAEWDLAARRLLAAQNTVAPAPFSLSAQSAWQPLSELLQRSFATQLPQKADISLAYPGLNAIRLQVRSRLAALQDGEVRGDMLPAVVARWAAGKPHRRQPTERLREGHGGHEPVDRKSVV